MTRLADGLVLFQRRLAPDRQRELWLACRGLADGAVPMYTPTVRGGRKMSVGMLCLGKHWNGLTYTLRSDGGPTSTACRCPPIPPAPSRDRTAGGRRCRLRDARRISAS